MIMPRLTKHRWLVGFLLLLLVAVMGIALLARGNKNVPACQRFAPHAWHMVDGYLAARTDKDGAVLLAYFPQESRSDLWKEKIIIPERPIYKWIPGQDQIFIVPSEDWSQASGHVVLGDELAHRNPNPLEHSSAKYLLKKESQTIGTVGRSVVKIDGSPDGKQVAVVSTDARPRSGFWPMSGSGIESDLYYHQIFDRNSGETVGTPLALRTDIRKWAPEICWSSDSRFVVYMDYACRWIWIAPVNHNPND
jgi:hypothetical protein